MKRILIAGGGTGGHIYPGLAVAGAFAKLGCDVEVFFAVTDRPIDQRALAATDRIEVVTQPIRPFSRSPQGLYRFGSGLVRSYRQMRRLLTTRQIDAVLGLGGFGSVGAVIAAYRLGLRTAIFNPDAIPGKANRLLARLVQTVFVQWPDSAAFFSNPVNVVGCPVRDAIKAPVSADYESLRAEAAKMFGPSDDLRTILVCGGSTGARSINQAVLKMLSQTNALPDKIRIIHITGQNDHQRLREQYARHVRCRYCVVDYVDRMELAYAAADMVICRAGAVTAAEVTAAALPAIFMPYPYHRDQHQRANADVLVNAGGALRVDDDARAGDTGDAGDKAVRTLTDAVRRLLDDRSRLARMSENLGSLARTDSDQEIARWLIAD